MPGARCENPVAGAVGAAQTRRMHPTFPVPLSGTRTPVDLWAPEHEIEPAAAQQLRNIAALPWVEAIKVMPGVHLGKGATVGSVIAMRDAVAPSAVGVDIGCGVAAVRTNLTLADLPDDLRPLRLALETAIPVGFQGHDGSADTRGLHLPRFARSESSFWADFDTLHPGVHVHLAHAALRLAQHRQGDRRAAHRHREAPGA